MVSGLTHMARRSTCWRISWAISASARRKTLSRSARLTMPSSGPAGSTTGSRLIPWRWSSLAASVTVASGPIVTAGAVISSTAVSPAALARSSRWRRPWSRRPPAGPSGNSSLSSRSASETIPTTRPFSSRTGRALIRHSSIRATISLKGACSSTVRTCGVMTSRTRRPMGTSCSRHPGRRPVTSSITARQAPGRAERPPPRGAGRPVRRRRRPPRLISPRAHPPAVGRAKELMWAVPLTLTSW